MQKLSISILFSVLLLIGLSLHAQKLSFPFEPSAENPFGLPNPEANPAIKDFAFLKAEMQTKLGLNPKQ